MDRPRIDLKPVPKTRSNVPIVLGLLLVLLAAGWCGFWYYASHKADTLIAGWLDREARSGRVYQCGQRSTGGFPFRFELRCADVVAELNSLQPPLWLTLKDSLVVSQVYQPTLLIGEFQGPLNLGEPGQPASYFVDWTSARTSVRGQPRSPERISVVVDNLLINHQVHGGVERMVAGNHAELHARLAAGAIMDRPILDIAARMTQLSAPGLHSLATLPIDADIDTTLRGLKDFAPKPWPLRFREMQEAGGAIEVKNARVAQGEWIAVGVGSLGLTPSGNLNGELRVTVAGLEKLLQMLGVDYLARPGTGDKLNSALNALDKIAPGLGNLARERASAGLAAGVAMLGQPAELEGRKAVSLPLRFDNGAAFLGPIAIGQANPLF